MIPDHTGFEVAEPEEVEAAPHRHAPPTTPGHPGVREVLVAVIAQRLPCPVCGATAPCRCAPPEGYSVTEARAALVEQALIAYGYLPDPEEEPSEFDAEETAQWLAERSGFPRYTQVRDGWRRLVEAEADVELAAIKATKRVPGDEVEMVKAARAALLAWHQSRKV